MKMRKFKKGFTLVELVVVIAVIAVLAAVSVGAYFGVTDSANSSAATQLQKQVTDLWRMFSVSSEYDTSNSDESMQKNAEYFCLDYCPNNGPDVLVNYCLINSDKELISKQADDIITNTTVVENSVMFLIQSDYTTWFVTEDENIIKMSSLVKTENDFKNSMDKEEQSFIHETHRAIFKEKGYSAFNLVSFGKDENGNEIRGYEYFRVIISGDETFDDYIKVSESLYSATKMFKPGEISTQTNPNGNSFYGKAYSITKDGVEFDTTQPFDIEKVPGVLIENTERDYCVGTIELVYTDLLPITSVNLNAFPVADFNLATGGVIFYNNFADFKENLPQEPDLSQHHYLFVGNTTLNVDLTIPSNYSLVVEYTLSLGDGITASQNISEMESYINNNYHVKENVINRYKGTDVNTGDTFYGWGNTDIVTIPGRVLNIGTPTDPVILTLEGNLFVEGFVMACNGSNPGYIKDAVTLNIETGSTIVSGPSSKIRAIGNIIGGGTLDCSNGGKIVEALNFVVYYGGTIVTTYFLIGGGIGSLFGGSYKMPTPDYYFNSIKTTLIIGKNSSYNLLGIINMSTDVSLGFELIGTNGMFRLSNDSYWVKGYNTERSRSTLTLIGTSNDGLINLKYGSYSVSQETIRLPICNLDIIVSPTGSLNFTTNNAMYEMPVTSSITVESKTLEDGSVLYGSVSVSKGSIAISNLASFPSADISNVATKGLFEKYNRVISQNIPIITNNGTITGNITSASSISNLGNFSTTARKDVKVEYFQKEGFYGNWYSITCKPLR